MNSFIELANNPFVVIAVAAAILLVAAFPLLHRRQRNGNEPRHHHQAIRAKAIHKLQAADSFRMLDLTERDAHTVLDVVIEDNLKLGGTYRRAAQHIQKAARQRSGALLNEDQISVVLAAYEQAQAD